MPRTRPPHPPEFRLEAVRPARSSVQSIDRTARDIGVRHETLRRLIYAEKPDHAVSRLARVFGVSSSVYHAWRHKQPSAHALADAALRERIEAIHES